MVLFSSVAVGKVEAIKCPTFSGGIVIKKKKKYIIKYARERDNNFGYFPPRVIHVNQTPVNNEQSVYAISQMIKQTIILLLLSMHQSIFIYFPF